MHHPKLPTSKELNQGAYHKAAAGQRQNKTHKQKKVVATVDPTLLVRKAVNETSALFNTVQRFQQMPIHQKILANLASKGFDRPTQIQEESFGHLAAGRDLLGIADTGTGKTAAFLIPVIDLLLKNPQPFTTLVVVPTRELALQVEQESKILTQGLGIRTASFIGGTSVTNDLGQLRKKHHIIIGAPGRLLDLANRGALRLDEISTLILDEFDRLLDMGFIHDIMKIVNAMSRRKQTMLFSATVDPAQRSLINSLLNDPVEVKVGSGASPSDQVEQDIIRVPEGGDKFSMLVDLLNNKEVGKALIFAETKRGVDRLSKKLNKAGVKADQIHGNKSQNYRNNALNRFKNGDVQALVATDVASRGIDVSDITHVINYQLPANFDNYIHRIGRTGRAGKTGKAFTFVDEQK